MMKIAFSTPDITQNEIDEVTNVLKSGWLTSGKITQQFENQLKNYTKADGVVCVSSGTAALELALRIAKITKGHEVILPAYTYTATAAAVLSVGATPVIVDCVEGFNLHPKAVEAALTEKTAAVIAVDIGGVCCDYDEILQVVSIKKRKNPKPFNFIERPLIIADAAHSLGGEYKGVKSGAVADLTAFSFHATKNLTTGEGGALAFQLSSANAKEVEQMLKIKALNGQSKTAFQKQNGDIDYDILEIGQKANLSDLQAAIGLSQLQRYDEMLFNRQEICKIYDASLPVGWSSLCHSKSSSMHLYMALLDTKFMDMRNFIINRLREKEIFCNIHFKPLPALTAYRKLGFKVENYPKAMELYMREISLPLSSVMSGEQCEYVCQAIKDIYKV